MKKLNKKLVAVSTIIIVLVMNINFWAKEYIEKMAEKNIITGYGDATFRPSKNVSKLGAVVMIFRTIKAADKLGNVDLEDLVEEYDSVLEANNVPSWAQEAIAFALEKDIISEDELEGFIDGNTFTDAKRIEVARYLGKALNLYLKEDINKKIFTFSFKDIEFIGSKDMPYLDLLIDRNIINGAGDTNGNFNPNKPIIRASVAKMLSVSYDILEDLEVGQVEEQVLPEEEQLTVKEVIITDVFEDSETLIFKDENDKRDIAGIGDAEIIINDKEADIDDLEKDKTAKLYYDEDGKIVKIEVDSNITSFEGKIKSIINMGGYYLITVENDEDDNRETFKINDDTVIKLNDDEAELEDLEDGDIVTMEIEEGVATEITAQSKTRIYKGILESSGVIFDRYPKIIVKTDSDKIYELRVDEDADVKRNGKTKSLMALVKGDIVIVTTEYDKVEKIVATTLENEDEGIISEIIISREPKITIINNDDETRTYNVSPNADIEIDDKDAEIYDLRLDYRVNLEIESNTVKKIEAEKVELSNTVTGIIVEVFDDFDAITVRINDGNGTKEISVSADDASIYAENDSRAKFRDLDEDDEVIIYGKKSSGIFDFIANKIFILKDN